RDGQGPQQQGGNEKQATQNPGHDEPPQGRYFYSLETPSIGVNELLLLNISAKIEFCFAAMRRIMIEDLSRCCAGQRCEPVTRSAGSAIPATDAHPDPPEPWRPRSLRRGRRRGRARSRGRGACRQRARPEDGGLAAAQGRATAGARRRRAAADP